MINWTLLLRPSPSIPIHCWRRCWQLRPTLELIQLQQWLGKNKDLKDKALADAAAKQPWDPSVQAMAGLPDVVKRLTDDIQWTTDLGNAFLAQQKDVMDAVQRMRAKAKDQGNLKSTEQVKVETKVVGSKQVIVVEQANPQVVYVPSYNPTVVYGPPVYPYPPITYPPPGYYAAGMAISFGVGAAMGAMWSGGLGWGCGWGGNNDITINNNNNFNRNTNIQGGNRTNNVAEYRVTGVKTFIVGYDGVVYQKDLGPDTLKIFNQMELYNPDKTWTPTDNNW